MPIQDVNFSERELAMLEQVRCQQGLDSIENTVEWLAKTRIRRGVQAITGQQRALYIIAPSPIRKPT